MRDFQARVSGRDAIHFARYPAQTLCHRVFAPAPPAMSCIPTQMPRKGRPRRRTASLSASTIPGNDIKPAPAVGERAHARQHNVIRAPDEIPDPASPQSRRWTPPRARCAQMPWPQSAGCRTRNPREQSPPSTRLRKETDDIGGRHRSPGWGRDRRGRTRRANCIWFAVCPSVEKSALSRIQGHPRSRCRCCSSAAVRAQSALVWRPPAQPARRSAQPRQT